MMMLPKLMLGLVVVVSAGLVAAGSGVIAAQGPSGGTAPPREPTVKDAAGPDLEKLAGEVDALIRERRFAELGRSRIEMARKRFEAQWKFYEEGRITIDRLLGASQTLMEAEVDVARTPEERLAPIRAHLERIKEVEKREKAELEVGRATTSDLFEAQTQRLDVEFRLAKEEAAAGPQRSGPADLERRVSELERKLDRLINLIDGSVNQRNRR